MEARASPRELSQGQGGEKRPGPGSKILGRDLFAADLAQIRVDLVRADRVSIAVVADILEELVSGQVAAALDDARQTPVAGPALVPHSAFAAKRETYRIAADSCMPIAQRGQAKAVIGL